MERKYSPQVTAGLWLKKTVSTWLWEDTTELDDVSLFLEWSLEDDILATSIEVGDGVASWALADIFGTHAVVVGFEAIVRPSHCGYDVSELQPEPESKICTYSSCHQC